MTSVRFVRFESSSVTVPGYFLLKARIVAGNAT